MRKFITQEIESIRDQSQIIAERVAIDRQFTAEEEARFYSSWEYMAVWIGSSFENVTVDILSEKFGIPLARMNKIVFFLQQAGLCQLVNDKLKIGHMNLHLRNESDYILQHHSHWRVKALNHLHAINHKNEVFYTCPMGIAQDDFPKIRSLIIESIEKILKIARPSKSEQLGCLIFDFFQPHFK